MEATNSAAILALIAIVGTVIAGLFKLLADLSASMKEMAKTNSEIAEATKTGNNEAKQRNGHLGEQNVQIATLVTHQGTDIAAIRQAVEKSTTVETQIGNDGKKSTTTISSHATK